MSSVEYEIDEEILDEIDISDAFQKQLVIHNDDVNTFEWVIICLVKICRLPIDQAEQLTLMVHTSGRASVKKGSYKELEPLKQAFLDALIQATIED